METALDQPDGQLDAFLEEACAGDAALEAEVRSLLVSHHAAGRFLEPGEAPLVIEELRSPGAQLAEGSLIGPWSVVRAIGEGGMGTVYLAERRTATARETLDGEEILKVTGPRPRRPGGIDARHDRDESGPGQIGEATVTAASMRSRRRRPGPSCSSTWRPRPGATLTGTEDLFRPTTTRGSMCSASTELASLETAVRESLDLMRDRLAEAAAETER